MALFRGLRTNTMALHGFRHLLQQAHSQATTRGFVHDNRRRTGHDHRSCRHAGQAREQLIRLGRFREPDRYETAG